MSDATQTGADNPPNSKNPPKTLEELRKVSFQEIGFNPPIDVWTIGAREMRHFTTEIIDRIKSGNTVFYISMSKVDSCGIMRVDDMQTLLALGSCRNIEGVIKVLSRWNRLGPSSTLVNSLKACRLDAQQGAMSTKSGKIGEFEQKTASHDQDGNVRAVEFSNSAIAAGQLTLMGSAETGWSIYGFLERTDPNAKLALELPTGQVIDNFDGEGQVLNLRRTPLPDRIDLLDVRVRRS